MSHRLHVVEAHLSHQPEVEERHAPVTQREQIAFVRVTVDEAVRHQLHREAAHSRAREGGTRSGRQLTRRDAVHPFGDQHTCRGEMLDDSRYHDAELLARASVQALEASDVCGLDGEVEFVK